MDQVNLEELRNITQCSICRSTFCDPRVLPCLHSFCLDCIQNAAFNRGPRDKMPCPLCRAEFAIPEDDFEGLQKDFRLKNLLEVSRVFSKLHQSTDFGDVSDAPEEHAGSHVIYCQDCRVGSNVRDYFDQHRGHKCSDIFRAVEDFRDQLAKNEEQAIAWETKLAETKRKADQANTQMLGEFSQAERAVKRKAEDIRQLVDAHTTHLENRLRRLKDHRLKELETEKRTIDEHLLNVRRFVAKCERLKAVVGKTSPTDVCQSAMELHKEMEKIEREQRVTALLLKKYSAPSAEINVKMTSIEDFLDTNRNIVADLDVKRPTSVQRSRLIAMVTSIFVIWKMLCISHFRILVSAAVGLGIGSLVAAGIDVTVGGLTGLCAAILILCILNALLPKSIPVRYMTSLKTQNRHACCVTYLRQRIYVILTSPSTIVVYSSDDPFTKQDEILAEPISAPYDCASCRQTSSIYITDTGHRCVWRFNPQNNQIFQWLTDTDRPHTISLSSDGRVAILRDDHSAPRLEVYQSDGAVVDRIPLPVSINQPYHAVETSTGTYFVSHGAWVTQTQSLVEINRLGVVMRSYNFTESLWGILKSVTLFLDPTVRCDEPRHLATDADDRVFAADWFSDRLLRFDSRFKFNQMYLTTRGFGAGWPIQRVCYVKETKHLLVVHETAKENRVHVYRLR